ncbi:hypothetical protein B566_EDAN007088 [Ephemera danica]|nr:hypothetical protein B566_EDAN007088 [Ephemera danica]
MEGLYLLIAILAMHFMLFFFDVMFKSCSHVPYLSFLQHTGLEVGVLRLRWSTTTPTRVFQRWAQWRPRAQAVWFSLGVVVSLGLMPVAAFLVLRGLGVLHEMGHALAAAREGVPVLACGAQLLLVLPVASVDLSTQRLAALPAWRRLRVLCAGVWHNVVIALVAVTLLHALAYTPAYSRGRGVSVARVDPNSGAAGPAGLRYGDHVTGVNGCLVSDGNGWRRCVSLAAHLPQSTYCVPRSLLDAPSHQDPCCPRDATKHLCFASPSSRWCLRAREITEVSTSPPCSVDTVALTPELEGNSTRLVVVHRASAPAVLFLGAPAELHAAVTTSDWVPAFSALPIWLPEVMANACSYLAALSAGLALLNLLPCYGFDGQHITNLLLERAFACCGVRSPAVASTVGAGFTAVGTGCLLAWLTTAVWKLVWL